MTDIDPIMQAAERQRRIKDGEHGSKVYEQDAWQRGQSVADLLRLADFALSELDSTPVDAEWMKSMGFVVEPNPDFYAIQTPDDETVWWDSKFNTLLFGAEGDRLIKRVTRGKVRTLYRMLDINFS